MSPGAPIGAHELPLGGFSSPARTLIASVVPDGVSAVQYRPQFVAPARSKTRDTNVPDAVYGRTWTQSTESCTPPGAASLAPNRIASPIGVGCVCRAVPSTLNTNPSTVQSIRYVCGVPRG